MGKTILDRIENVAGKITAYDGNLVVWSSTGVHDIRDVLRTMRGVTLKEVQESLEVADAQASKERKAAIKAAKESAE